MLAAIMGSNTSLNRPIQRGISNKQAESPIRDNKWTLENTVWNARVAKMLFVNDLRLYFSFKFLVSFIC